MGFAGSSSIFHIPSLYSRVNIPGTRSRVRYYFPSAQPSPSYEDQLHSGFLLVTSLTVDKFYYGRLQFPVLNFIKVNFSSVSLFYGQCPWHYYLTQGLPILCTTSLPFVVQGIYATFRPVGAFPRHRLALRCLA